MNVISVAGCRRQTHSGNRTSRGSYAFAHPATLRRRWAAAVVALTQQRWGRRLTQPWVRVMGACYCPWGCQRAGTVGLQQRAAVQTHPGRGRVSGRGGGGHPDIKQQQNLSNSSTIKAKLLINGLHDECLHNNWRALLEVLMTHLHYQKQQEIQCLGLLEQMTDGDFHQRTRKRAWNSRRSGADGN